MTYIIGTIVLIFLVYAFQGFLSFPFWFLGVVFKFLYLPINIIDQVIYPVGVLPFIVLSGSITFIIIYIIFSFFHHK